MTFLFSLNDLNDKSFNTSNIIRIDRRSECTVRKYKDRRALPSVTNNPRTYPPKAGQLDAICARGKREKEKEKKPECPAA